MAWKDVQLIETGPLVETQAADGSIRASVPSVYYVEADAVITLDAALTASFGGVTIPAMAESYSVTRPNCRCRKRSVEFKTPYQATVKCEFEDPTNGASLVALPSQSARISSSPESFTEGYQVDAEGSKVVNAAGEVFDNPPQRQAGVKAYQIKKYVNATVKAQIAAAWNTNNNAEITIDGDTWAADEGWLYSYSFEPVDGSTLWDATIVIKCKVGGWKDQPLNVGFRDNTGADIRIKKSVGPDPDGELVSKPWPLDETGAAKAGTNPTPDALVFYPYSQNAWAGVPLA
jgi:hypothetical protein